MAGYGGGMSSAKAALESDTRVLAYEAGRKFKVRVNTISAGPLGSRAAKAIGFIDDMIRYAILDCDFQLHCHLHWVEFQSHSRDRLCWSGDRLRPRLGLIGCRFLASHFQGNSLSWPSSLCCLAPSQHCLASNSNCRPSYLLKLWWHDHAHSML